MYLAEISPTSLRGAVTTTLFPLIIIVIVIVIVILTNWQTHSDLCFDAWLAAGHRLPAHHHNVHSPLAGDLIAQSCVYEDDDDVHDIAAGQVDSGGQQAVAESIVGRFSAWAVCSAPLTVGK